MRLNHFVSLNCSNTSQGSFPWFMSFQLVIRVQDSTLWCKGNCTCGFLTTNGSYAVQEQKAHGTLPLLMEALETAPPPGGWGGALGPTTTPGLVMLVKAQNWPASTMKCFYGRKGLREGEKTDFLMPQTIKHHTQSSPESVSGPRSDKSPNRFSSNPGSLFPH